MVDQLYIHWPLSHLPITTRMRRHASASTDTHQAYILYTQLASMISMHTLVVLLSLHTLVFCLYPLGCSCEWSMSCMPCPSMCTCSCTRVDTHSMMHVHHVRIHTHETCGDKKEEKGFAGMYFRPLQVGH